MDSREQMKNAFLTKLEFFAPYLSGDDLQKVAMAFDIVSSEYAISETEKHLAVLGREQMQELIKTYIVVKKMEGLSDNTLERYANTLGIFMRSSTKPIDEITGNDIRLFLYNYQKTRGITSRSLDGIRSIVCTFFNWAMAERYIAVNPAQSVKAIKYEVKPRKSLEQLDLERLRRACRTHRELALVETLYSTGCRVSELTAIKLSDINWDKHTVHLFGKGKKHRTSFINAKAEIALREYLKTRKVDSEYLFVGERGQMRLKKEAIERSVRILAKRAGLGDKGITPHVLRHTTATQALKNGMPVNDIQKLLGHSSVATTMIYAHTSLESVQAGHLKCVV